MSRDNGVAPYFWVQDSGGRNILCANEPNLTLEEAIIGSLTHNPGNEFVALDKDGNELGVGNLYQARKIVEAHVSKKKR